MIDNACPDQPPVDYSAPVSMNLDETWPEMLIQLEVSLGKLGYPRPFKDMQDLVEWFAPGSTRGGTAPWRSFTRARVAANPHGLKKSH